MVLGATPLIPVETDIYGGDGDADPPCSEADREELKDGARPLGAPAPSIMGRWVWPGCWTLAGAQTLAWASLQWRHHRDRHSDNVAAQFLLDMLCLHTLTFSRHRRPCSQQPLPPLPRGFPPRFQAPSTWLCFPLLEP